MKVIDVKNLDFYYDENTHAVDNVSFTIEKGSYTTIIGHNGSGKSTIAKLLLGLLEKNSGEIKINGLELTLENLDQIRSNVGIVFQNPDNQFIGATVRDDIAFGLENRCIEPSLMDGIIEEFSKKVNMYEYLDREPSKLSGGQKQRVAIAGVLAMHPQIIIFDEATSMLDPKGKAEIKQSINNLHLDSDITILSITHDIEEVSKSDNVIVMHEGKVVKTGTPDEILMETKTLVDLKLDTSFAVKTSQMLQAKGLNIATKIDQEGLVAELCQLNLKK